MGEVKVVYVSHCSEVYVSDTTDHKHEVDKDYINTSDGYKWSHEATDIIITGIKNNASPKVILCNLCDKNVFDGSPEVTKKSKTLELDPNLSHHYNTRARK